MILEIVIPLANLKLVNKYMNYDIWVISDNYSYNSIKRIYSIKRPGLEFFKKFQLNVPYYQKTACT